MYRIIPLKIGLLCVGRATRLDLSATMALIRCRFTLSSNWQINDDRMDREMQAIISSFHIERVGVRAGVKR